MKMLTIRLSDEDHQLFGAVAEAEDMPVTTMIRRLVRTHARQLGMLEDPKERIRKEAKAAADAHANPPVERLPIPRNGNLWGHTMLQRSEAGEPVTTIAASYGVAVQVVQTQIADAKRRRAEGNDAHTWEDMPETGRTAFIPAHLVTSTTARASAPQPARTEPATPEEIDWDNIDPDAPCPQCIRDNDELAQQYNQRRFEKMREKYGWNT